MMWENKSFYIQSCSVVKYEVNRLFAVGINPNYIMWTFRAKHTMFCSLFWKIWKKRNIFSETLCYPCILAVLNFFCVSEYPSFFRITYRSAKLLALRSPAYKRTGYVYNKYLNWSRIALRLENQVFQEVFGVKVCSNILFCMHELSLICRRSQ